jgi:hypothetical protein
MFYAVHLAVLGIVGDDVKKPGQRSGEREQYP